MARILICDDSSFVRTIFEKRLAAFGYEVVGKAKDGLECLKMHAQLKPDLILLDITMPNMDGRTALRNLMSMNNPPTVIMITAIGDEAVRNECLRDGAKAFVSKALIASDEDFKKHVIDVLNDIFAKPKSA